MQSRKMLGQFRNVWGSFLLSDRVTGFAEAASSFFLLGVTEGPD